MATTLMSRWQKFHHGTPGRRFRDRYQANRRKIRSYPWIGRLVRTALAVAALAIGVVLMFIPGPAILFFFIAGTLLAADSLAIARILDVLELRLRKIWKWIVRHWKATPAYGKVMLAGALAASSLACAYAAYLFVR